MIYRKQAEHLFFYLTSRLKNVFFISSVPNNSSARAAPSIIMESNRCTRINEEKKKTYLTWR